MNVLISRMMQIVNVTQLSMDRADKGKLPCDTMEKFGTKMDVEDDGNGGHHAIMTTLKYIGRECKETVKEVRRDIWECVSNC